jgi:DNA-binding CsgD family transcriptional regulator
MTRSAGSSADVLRPDDREDLLAALRAIGAAEGIVDFGMRTCREMLRLVPGVSASYNEVSAAADRIAVVVYPDPGRDVINRFAGILERNLHDSPIVQQFDKVGEGEVVTWTDLDPDGAIFKTTLYREFYRPLGIHNQIAFMLPAPPGISVVLAVNGDGRTFERREHALLAELRLHLVNIYRLVSYAEAARQHDVALADDGWSVVLVNDDGIVLESNELAVAIGAAAGIDLGVGASLAGGALWAELAGSRVDMWAVSRPAGPTTLPQSEVPFEARLLRSAIGPHVVWLREPVRVTLQDAIELGLTPRQAQIALLLVDGLTNDQIARRLSISRGTVRKHLEVVFVRLDVPSRAAAVGKLQARARGRQR